MYLENFHFININTLIIMQGEYEMAERKLQTNNHCKNLIMYHLIFVCKYRRKVFSNHDFAEELKLQISEVAKRYDFQIDTIDLDYPKPDHIHILIRNVPKLSPLQIVRVLKQQTNFWAWQKFDSYLKKFYWRGKHLWTRGYFCSTVGNVSAETVHKYLEKQGGNE